MIDLDSPEEEGLSPPFPGTTFFFGLAAFAGPTASGMIRSRPLFSVDFGLKLFYFPDQSQELFAEVGQMILDPWRDLWELLPLENSGTSEISKAVTQDFGADAFDVALNGSRATHATRYGPQHRECPTTTDDVF